MMRNTKSTTTCLLCLFMVMAFTVCFTANAISADKKINLNTATLAQLSKLPGMTEAAAKKILKYRSDNDGFTAVEELLEIIDEGLFNKIEKYIEVKKKEGCDC